MGEHILRSIFRRKESGDGGREGLPQWIDMPALGERWQVVYRDTESATVRTRSNGSGLLTVSGSVSDHRLVTGALRRWLARQGKKALVAWLEELSWEYSLPYQRVAVRGQTTRWGSCSTRGNINLNWKLLFLPPEVVRYVLLHELCHTVHPDHSHRFWMRLAAMEPYYRSYRSAARRGMEMVPPWAR